MLDKIFLQLLRERSRELCPDYPNIQQDLDPWEYLWALTSSLEGTRLANDDMHDFAGFLIKELGWTYLEAVDKYHKYKEQEVKQP